MEAQGHPGQKGPHFLAEPQLFAARPRMTAQAMANSVSSSREWAMRPVSRGMTYFIIQGHGGQHAQTLGRDEQVGQVGRAPPATDDPRVVRRPGPGWPQCPERSGGKPMAIWLVRESISFLSDRSLTMMMVLEKVRATAT